MPSKQKMSSSVRLFLFLALLPISSFAYTKIDLADLQWTVRSDSQDINVAATVPGGIYTDLMNAGVLNSGPFYYRSNDENYRWVAYDNWTYSASFDLDHDSYDHNNVVLEFKGLDTAATVRINGVTAATTDNMFRRYVMPINNLVTLGRNDIDVSFESPISYSKRKFEEQTEIHVVPPECVDPQFQGECHANHIRKMQASFSWDWGPAFPSMGIWQAASLEAYDKAILKYVKWNPTSSGNNWVVTVDLIFDSNPDTITVGTASLALASVGNWDFEVSLLPSVENPREASVQVEITVAKADVELWWPNESGEQKLYALEASFRDDAFDDLSSLRMNVGFRTVELIQEPLVQGLSYKFRVNGIYIFMKGSNWIPAHVLPEQVTREYIYQLLLSAKEAHMNMLRIWGGGIYELDAFYEIADELGILIWHDHMFACSMYQANPENLINADLESQHQIRRLQHHPSVALWAGNNENEAALRDNWYGTNSNFELYKDDYIKLYVDTIMRRAQMEDPGRAFLISSPNNGEQSINEGYIAQNPQSPIYGDRHYYNYAEDNWDYTTFPSTRFGSEYGFQSFPSFEIIRAVSEPSDWSFSSDFMNHRQRHPNGNNELVMQISSKMDIPTMAELDTEEGFREFLYLAQLYQAISLKTETEHYRRHKTDIDPVTGEGQCMGALYWQLNDVWPGASWTSQEHGGKWKISHYIAEKMFRDVIVSPIVTAAGNLEVHLISDRTEELTDLTLEVSVQSWDGFEITYTEQTEIATFPAQTSALVFTKDTASLLASGGCAAAGNCFYNIRLTDASGQIDESNHWSTYAKNNIGMSVPTLTITSVVEDPSCASRDYPTCFNIDITTSAVAQYVWIEAIGISGHFDDNGFLLNTPSRRLRLLCRDPNVSAQQVQSALQIRSYKNSYVTKMEEKEHKSLMTNLRQRP